MRYVLSLVAVTLVMLSCNNATGSKTAAHDATKTATDTATFTSVQWIDSVKEVGAIKFGETVDITFRFKNTGSYPLFIIAAQPGCGCTVTDFPKGAIGPGQEGTISAAFDTKKGNEGVFRKNINVTTNTQGSNSHLLFFSGTIVRQGGTGSSGRQAAGL